MVNNLKIIFFGLGSIGKRHLSLIQKKFDFELAAYRSNRNSPKVKNVQNFYEIEKALNYDYDIAFITNPTHLHVRTAILCIKARIKNLFIEKPISHNLENIEQLRHKIDENKCTAYIAYNMRYNPVIRKLKEIVDSESNTPFFVETRCCSFLPDWRPERDYRKVYSAIKEKGGGVILDLSHEFDYNEYLFGEINNIEGKYSHLSNLAVNSEDFCNAIIKFNTSLRGIIYLDYFSRIKERWIKIHYPNKEILCDLNQNYINITYNGKTKEISFDFARNDVYEAQLDYYFENVIKNPSKINNLNESLDLFEKIIKFKENNDNEI